MSAQKTNSPIRFLAAIFTTIALALGGSLVAISPANAASLSGCKNSGWQPRDCGGDGTVAIVTALADVNGVVTPSTAVTSQAPTISVACVAPVTYALYNSADTNYAGTAVTLPTGLTFSTSTGQISGTPSVVYNQASFIILATCSSANFERFSINVTVTATAVPTISPATQTVNGTVGTAITASAAYVANNFGAGLSYAVRGGTNPAGLTFETSTGVFRGTPTAISSVTVTIDAADSSSAAASATITFNIVAAAQQNNNSSSSEPDRKVTICHRTHAVTNPYVRITVDYNSVNKKSGHQGHDEIFAGAHVFAGASFYPRAKDKLWGDIIPADPTGLNRWKPLNWTELGAKIYNGTAEGCPAYDAVKYYNQLREAGVPEKKIKAEIAELENEQAEAKPIEKTDTTKIKYTGSNAKALEEEKDKVTICHRTNSVTNPYRRITVAASSIYKTKGHYSHDEIYAGNHVFDASVNYPTNQKDWGDIIPADPTGQNRWQPLNMTTLGKAIYEGTVAGCSELTNEEFYNKMREEGLPKSKVKKELEEQGNVDDDPKDVDDSHYTGTDPNTEKTEPKPPVQPENKKPVDQSLTGIVWLDLNRDGLKDSNEPFMPNIVLSVVPLNSTSTAAVTVKTDANGYYEFPSLGAGDWKVVTGIPSDFGVTYDSYTLSDGEIITTVPVGSIAFTWAALAANDPIVEKKYIEQILRANPAALPRSELPAWYLAEEKAAKAKAASASRAAAIKKAAVLKGNLAFTGDNLLLWLMLGGLFTTIGVVGLRKVSRRKVD